MIAITLPHHPPWNNGARDMNRYARYSAKALPVFALLITPALSSAANWSVSARAETGFQYYSFEQSPVLGLNAPWTFPGFEGDPNWQGGSQSLSLGKLEYEATMPIASGGLSLVMDRFFIDANVLGAYDGSDDDSRGAEWTAQGNQGVEGSSDTIDILWNEQQQRRDDVDFDRVEYALSAGYAVTQSFAVYAGWKWASTSFDMTTTTSSDSTALLVSPGVELGNEVTGQSNFRASVDWDFNQDGPFIGAAYVWRLNGPLKGALTANAALAFLQGEIDTETGSAQEIDEAGNPIGEPGPTSKIGFEGDTTALTLGFSWRGETGVKGLSYILGVNGYTYSFTADSLDNQQGFAGTDGGDITETVLNFKVGLAYRF